MKKINSIKESDYKIYLKVSKILYDYIEPEILKKMYEEMKMIYHKVEKDKDVSKDIRKMILGI